MERRPYREDQRRERQGYHPTEKAWDLYPVIVGLMQWGERHLLGPEDGTVTLVDQVTGRPVRAAVVVEGTPACAPRDVVVETIGSPGVASG